MSNPVVLALTAGEPAGIGPELCLQLALESRTCGVVVVASRPLLEARAKQMNLAVELRPWQPGEAPEMKAGLLSVRPVEGCANDQAGSLDTGSSAYVVRTLEVAANGCLDGEFDGMVTAPVHKGVINDAGILFSGHTEFLQELCGVDREVMLLATEALPVALVTPHLPPTDFSPPITPDTLPQDTGILAPKRKKFFGIWLPRL